jgi:hypothetical protein
VPSDFGLLSPTIIKKKCVLGNFFLVLKMGPVQLSKFGRAFLLKEIIFFKHFLFTIYVPDLEKNILFVVFNSPTTLLSFMRWVNITYISFFFFKCRLIGLVLCLLSKDVLLAMVLVWLNIILKTQIIYIF